MPDFEWDAAKDGVNLVKHGVGFEFAQLAFLDPSRVIAEDLTAVTNSATSASSDRGCSHDGALHVAKPEDQDFRGRLLAQGKDNL